MLFIRVYNVEKVAVFAFCEAHGDALFILYRIVDGKHFGRTFLLLWMTKHLKNLSKNSPIFSSKVILNVF